MNQGRSVVLTVALLLVVVAIHRYLSRRAGQHAALGSEVVGDPEAPLFAAYEVDETSDVFAAFESRLPTRGSLYVDPPPSPMSVPAQARALRLGPMEGEGERDTWNRASDWLRGIPAPAADHFALQRLLDQDEKRAPKASGWWRTHLLRGEPLLTTDDVTDAVFEVPDAAFAGSSGRVTLTLSPAAADTLRGTAAGSRLALLFSGVVEAAPWILVKLDTNKLTLPVDPPGREAEAASWVEAFKRARFAKP